MPDVSSARTHPLSSRFGVSVALVLAACSAAPIPDGLLASASDRDLVVELVRWRNDDEVYRVKLIDELGRRRGWSDEVRARMLGHVLAVGDTRDQVLICCGWATSTSTWGSEFGRGERLAYQRYPGWFSVTLRNGSVDSWYESGH